MQPVCPWGVDPPMTLRTLHTPPRTLTIAVVALAVTVSGCARIKARLGMEPAHAALPGPPPTAETFAGKIGRAHV